MARCAQRAAAGDPDPRRRAAGRLRSLSRQARRRRGRRRLRDDLPRRPRRARRGDPLPPARARAAGARRRSSRSETTAGAARSPSTRRAAGRSRVIAWTDRIASWQRRGDPQARGRADRSRRRALGGPCAPRRRTCRSRRRSRSTSDDRHGEVELDVKLGVDVDAELARFGAWYELFPRSWGGFAGVEKVLPQLAELGFDVVYLPPIHPIGRTNRKGRNNAVTAKRGDVGSPWAIGAEEGGHTAIHPDLGTLADFERLVARARETRHRDRARLRDPVLTRPPVAEGASRVVPPPPRRHAEVRGEPAEEVPGHLQRQLRVRGLARAVGGVARRDAPLGVARRARVPRRQSAHEAGGVLGVADRARCARVEPNLVLLSEAFTRPAMMTTLAKVGFSQSYTYFTWKNTKAELEELMAQILDWTRVLPAELLREHAGHPPRVPAARRAAGVRGAARARGDAVAGVRDLLRLRELRERAGARGLGGVPRLGEVRGEEAQARRAAAAARAAAERDPPRGAGAAAGRQPALARDRAGATRRVHQGRPRRAS